MTKSFMSGLWKKARNLIVGVPAAPAQARGRRAEEHAAAYLAARGLKLLAHNVRCRGGEIDLICLERDTVVFVEVRLRANEHFGGAAASIDAAKRRRIVLAARWWLAGPGHGFAAHDCRFDAVLFDNAEFSAPHWIRAAFEVE
jgi:putative endonuclease